MVPLRTVLSLALLGLATSAGQYGSSPPHSSYGAPKPSGSYGVPKPSSSYGAPRATQGGASLGGRQPSFVGLSGSSGPSGPSRTGLVGPSGSQRIRPQRGQVHSKYYLSWQHGSEQYTWDEADNNCRSRRSRLVSLTTAAKDQEIARLLRQAHFKVDFYWTSGMKVRGKFVWGDHYGTHVCLPRRGEPHPYCYQNWSKTGFSGRYQPDDREGQENCLAVLNDFYRDGIVWHDIACHHRKHFVCEYY